MWLDPEVVRSVPSLLDGWLITVELTLLGAAGSLACGHLALAMQLTRCAPLRIAARLYIGFMRGTPSLVQLFLVFFALPLIGLGGRPMLAAALTLGLNSGAYTAEILRGNMRVVTRGQIEAATALGMAPWRIALRIALPQMLKASVPALVNEFTILLKTTPLASVVAVTELTYAGQMVIARIYTSSQIMLLVSVGYLAVVLPVIWLGRHLRREPSASRGT
ncbi:amino acid ABC transporter permease [Paraburkholderia caballeronis]|uniref:Polar amino acid transport system permease protein n=1 Tax=Paraburkholderia caballeronis TaxID=416943 RepID=A0A1H7M0G9_9BURK|nr:amino acid ABC transporter permease [Paraburkholderia caballeronis]PXW28659.1 polar amino acid transport system permease protein [Paraburkholderia caballeronis]PXX04025.1 polar amino acid transport system permease protein [Paraburkholderia caballeronis]RAK04769.1 polar amino acid transport system permease protein [Paraburkholderia caballeronis]SED65913.1 polar amino acid transport system permease protein [Paraburkholderia caballeronis]SEL04235.1 polar amino acid transport system permease pr